MGVNLEVRCEPIVFLLEKNGFLTNFFNNFKKQYLCISLTNFSMTSLLCRFDFKIKLLDESHLNTKHKTTINLIKNQRAVEQLSSQIFASSQ